MLSFLSLYGGFLTIYIFVHIVVSELNCQLEILDVDSRYKSYIASSPFCSGDSLSSSSGLLEKRYFFMYYVSFLLSPTTLMESNDPRVSSPITLPPPAITSESASGHRSPIMR